MSARENVGRAVPRGSIARRAQVSLGRPLANQRAGRIKLSEPRPITKFKLTMIFLISLLKLYLNPRILPELNYYFARVWPLRASVIYFELQFRVSLN